MAKKVLTDRSISALKPADPGKRYEVMDAVVPGLGIRVTDKADERGKAKRKTFVLVARFPGSSNPARRSLGEYGALGLEDAREKARDWHKKIAKGIDPAEDEKRAADAERERLDTTFGAVMEDYIARHLKGKRKAKDAEREIRNELIPVWKDKPVDEITRRDVVNLIESIADRPAPYQAHNVFGHVRTFFNWAINRGIYGLEFSPCDRLKPATLIGAKAPRQRVLTDDELAALWRAADRLGFPFGPMFLLLAVTGQRKSDVSNASWREFDLENRLWTIPAGRFKSNAQHIVPLSDDAIAILKSLPRFKKGNFVFTTTYGEKPVSGFSKAKARLDRRMTRTLKALTRKREGAEAARAYEMEPFVIHDLRRTMRTRLSSLRVPDQVAEMVIGHGRKGLQRVYDQHSYEPEMREALAQWAARIQEITTPPPANVVKLEARA